VHNDLCFTSQGRVAAYLMGGGNICRLLFCLLYICLSGCQVRSSILQGSALHIHSFYSLWQHLLVNTEQKLFRGEQKQLPKCQQF